MTQQIWKRGAGRWLGILVLLCIVAVFSGCRTVTFYAQAIKGEYQILSSEEPIDRLIANQGTPAHLKAQLELVQRLRAYAARELKLPVDNHYAKYSDLHRQYVVWNVQAAPEFSLQPKTWWYPFVGSLEYRGYFSERDANDYARRIRKKGGDVYVDGVEAYSTLGWFKDPVLSTFVDGREPELAEVLFHELGHQRVFARGDTDFNEAFATTVGQEGARRWLIAGGSTNLFNQYVRSLNRNDQFVHLIMKTRERLEKIYGDTLDKDGKVRAAKHPPAPADQLGREKQRIFGELQNEYTQLKSEWGGYSGYDEWFGRQLNNAQLNTIANYYDYVPGFEALLQLHGGDMEAFYRSVERLSRMPREERHQWLRELGKNPKGEVRSTRGGQTSRS